MYHNKKNNMELHLLILINRSLLFFLLPIYCLLGISSASAAIILTPEQKVYLDSRGPITMCIDPDWMPYEKIDTSGKHIGMTADYMELFSSMLSKEIKLIPTTSWPQSEEFAKQRKCDILSLLNITNERSTYLNFTDPYIEATSVLVATDNIPYIDGLKSMSGKTLAIVKDYWYEDLISEKYPDIKLEYVENMDVAFEKVSEGKIFATVGSLFIVTDRIQELGLSNLKIAGTAEFKNYLRIGVRNDDPALLELFRLAVKNIDPKTENKILRRWVSVRFEHGTDYTLLIQIIVISIIIILLLLYRNRSVKQIIAKLNEANELLNEKSKELHRLSHTDSLTTLYNRLHLDEKLEEEVERFKRYQTPCACILIDIDYFKKINDDYGHAEGDRVLKYLSLTLLENIRINDILGRWGGEEFLIICPETKTEGALQLAEKLRSVVEQSDYQHRVTCSFGIAEISEMDNATSLVSKSDHALYVSKKSGRNCVTLYNPEKV